MTYSDRPVDAPWPIVDECHSRHIADHSCPQCDGSHAHEWVAWHGALDPQFPGSSVVGQMIGPGIPVRCKTCGGRKCDLDSCRLRRHHREDHEDY